MVDNANLTNYPLLRVTIRVCMIVIILLNVVKVA